MDNKLGNQAKNAPKFKPHTWKIKDQTLSVQTIPYVVPFCQLPINRYSKVHSPHSAPDYKYSTHIYKFKICPPDAEEEPVSFKLYSIDFEPALYQLGDGNVDRQLDIYYQNYLSTIKQAELLICEEEKQMEELHTLCKPFLYDGELARSLQKMDQSIQNYKLKVESLHSDLASSHDICLLRCSYDPDCCKSSADTIQGSSMSIFYRSRYGKHKTNFFPFQIRIENYQLSKQQNGKYTKLNLRPATIYLSFNQFRELVNFLEDEMNQIIFSVHIDT